MKAHGLLSCRNSGRHSIKPTRINGQVDRKSRLPKYRPSGASVRGGSGMMVNQRVLTVSIKLRTPDHPNGPRGGSGIPTSGGSFANGAPRREFTPHVGKLANLGPNAATYANVSETVRPTGWAMPRFGGPQHGSI